ncbi:hypothetical protein AMTRI_Chr02g219010 [Amborella trichopoda]
MEGRRRMMGSHRSRPIPKRGQVKVAIVVGFAKYLASFFANQKGRSFTSQDY